MQRRLPLAFVPTSGVSHPSAPASGDESFTRVPLSGATIGIADPQSGLVALEFALALATAFGALGQAAHVALLDFVTAPSTPRHFAERFAALHVEVSAHAIDARAAQLPGSLCASPAWLLCVGVPAVTAFAPRLSLVVGADTPLPRWPAWLRATRPTLALELMQLRPGLAEALAGSLNVQGFLPPGGHGVRL